MLQKIQIILKNVSNNSYTDEIYYKKFCGRISLSTPGVELEAPKICFIENL